MRQEGQFQTSSCFLKNLYMSLVSIYFQYIKTNYKTLVYDLLNLWYSQSWFFRKWSGNSFPTTFCVWFFLKKFFSCYVLLTEILPLLLQILGNMCIEIVCFPGCDAINFEINLNFLIKSFFYMTKKLRQIFKNVSRAKMSREQELLIFTNIKGLSVAENCLRLESVPLNSFFLHFFLFY